MLSDQAQQSLPQDAQVALQQVDNRESSKSRTGALLCTDSTAQLNTSSSPHLLIGRQTSIFGDSCYLQANTCRASYGK